MKNQCVISLIKTNRFSYEDKTSIRGAVFEALDRINAKMMISPGQTVLIKPNLVSDINYDKSGGIQCLYTQPEVIDSVIEYVGEALKGKGNIIIGDAPVQECNFNNLQGIKDVVKKHQNTVENIELIDFREVISYVKAGVHKTYVNEQAKGKIINLGKDSAFYGEKDVTLAKMRITNYDPRILQQHHIGEIQEYYITEHVLQADVIINMPKPKTHRKAGMTGALKNMVGVNIRKEFLPHHTLGALSDGGDEYLKKSIVHLYRSKLLDKKNVLVAEKKYFMAKFLRYPIRVLSMILKIMGQLYSEGSWYGNDTISRTISDINRVVFYANKDGRISEEQQRKMIIIADMIVAGEGEGPLFPTPKKVGMIVAGTNPVCFDEIISTLMGLDYKKIPTIVRARKDKNRLSLVDDMYSVISSNSVQYDEKTVETLNGKDLLWFKPSKGWIGHIEKEF